MQVPVIDQNGRACGTAQAPAMMVEAYADDEGVIWTPPTAWAYFAVCRARNNWADRAHEAERLLARLVDIGGYEGDAQCQAIALAEAFLRSKMGKMS